VEGLYCERISAGVEPLNTLTNVGFFIVAWLVWRLVRKAPEGRGGGILLAVLIAAIGAGSAAFHAIGTPAARYLDIVPIVLFQLVFVGLYASRVLRADRWSVAASLCAFLLASWLGDGSPVVPSGSLSYVPAAGVGLAFGWYRRGLEPAGAADLRFAAAVFLLALIFRSLDPLVCPGFSHGTHFVWHLLVPCTLYLAVRGLVRDLSAGPGASRRSNECLWDSPAPFDSQEPGPWKDT
jgi:hypothetical protein